MSKREPWSWSLLWLLGAPLVVVVTLEIFHDLWIVFVGYHILVCLILPLLDSLIIRRTSLRDHLAYVGLTGPRCRAGFVVGMGLGAALGMGTVGFFALWGNELLAGNEVEDVLAGWGMSPDQVLAMTVFMVLGNGMAEELYWRGFLHRRLEPARHRGLAIGVTALCYTSYHIFTLGSFLADGWLVALLTAAVLAGGLFFGWLRERFGNVWPALLGHAGATAGYMVVYWIWIVRNQGSAY